MSNFQNQPFYENLNNDFKSKVIMLENKVKVISFYEKIQLWGSIAIIIYFIIDSRNAIFSHTFSFDSINSYLCILFIGVFFILIEKMVEPIKKDLKKAKESIKNKIQCYKSIIRTKKYL